MLPRMVWVNKKQTLQSLHHQVFEYLQQIISEWLEWKDPETAYTPKADSKIDLRKLLP
jgi:hypothetical protein